MIKTFSCVIFRQSSKSYGKEDICHIRWFNELEGSVFSGGKHPVIH